MEFFGYKIEKKSSIQDVNNAFSSLITSGYELKNMNISTYYDMFRRNADIKSCIREIQNTAGKSGFNVLQKKGVDKDGVTQYKNISDDIFIQSFLKETAKNFQNLSSYSLNIDTWASFNIIKKEVIKHLKVSGNLFLLKKYNKAGKLASVDVINSCDVNIITDSKLNVLYYLVRKGSGIDTYIPEHILHYVTTYDTKDRIYGISELSGIVYEAYSDNEAGISNYYSMLNNSVPAGLYILDENIPEDKIKELVNSLKKEMTGSKNRNKSIISNYVKDYKKLSETNKDMDFVEMRKFNSEKICSALGVSKAILSYTDGINYANGESQYKKFIENTIRPMEFDLSTIFSYLLSEIYPDVWLEIVDNHINDKKEKLEIVEKGINIGVMTRNEGREYLGNIKEENELMDKYTVLQNVKLLDDLEFSVLDNGVITTNPTN